MRSRRLRLALLASTALGFAASPALAAIEIGVAAAVNPMATGAPPQQRTRVLQVGTDMTANEKVVTGAVGQAQLLFLDGSALTVGPNSEIVLDEFVYDPETKEGRLAFAATKGVFRLVGGHLSKRTPVTIRTPTATVGIRGGIAIMEVGEDGVRATFLFGDEMTVTSEGETQRAIRPGFVIESPQAVRRTRRRGPIDQIDRTLSRFEGSEGQDGGAPVPPADEDVAQTQIAAVNSVQASEPASGGRTGDVGAAGGGAQPPQDEVSEASQNEATDDSAEEEDEEGDDGAGDGSGQDSSDGGQVVNPPAEPPAQPMGVTIAAALSGRFRLGSEGAGAENGTIGDEPFSGAVVADGVFTGGGVSLPVEDGAFQVPPTALPAFDGAVFEGNGWLSANRDFLFYELEDAAGEQRLLAFAGIPTPLASFLSDGFTAYEFRHDFVLGSDVPFIRTGGVGFASAAPALGYIDWSTNRFLLGKVVIEGQGPSQRTAGGVIVGQTVLAGDPGAPNIEGGFRGASRVAAASMPYFFSSLGPQELALPGSDGAAFFGADGPNDFVLGVDVIESGPNAAGNFGPNIVAQKTTGTQGPRTSATLNGFVAGLAQEIGDDPGVFSVTNFNADSFTAGDPADFRITLDGPSGTLSGALGVNDDSGYGIALTFGGSDAGESAFFDDDTFAATESSAPATLGLDSTADRSFFLTTADALELIGALPDGVSLCDCQYLRWGVLGLDIGDPQAPGNRTQIQLAGWVAGDVTAQVDLPTTGVATYAGHVFGNVYDGANFYSAVGGLEINFDFANTTSSMIEITDFDGVDYSAPVQSLQANGVYSGFAAEQGLLGDRSISFKAAFFAGGGDLVAETGGQFRISGGGYLASGVMAAKQTSIGPSPDS